MSVGERINRFFGVMPPNTMRRLTIAMVAMSIVLVLDIVVLFGKNLELIQRAIYLPPHVINTLLISSVLFTVSLIYYIIVPGRSNIREQAYSLLK